MKAWTRQFLAYVAIASVLLIVALFAFGQAVTLAWLSAFPAWEPAHASLQLRFWAFLAVGLIALVVGVGAVLRWVLQQNGRLQDSGSRAPKENWTEDQ